MLSCADSPLSSPALSLVFILSMLGFVLPGSTTLVNVTVDDTYGNQETGDAIQYAPAGVWKFGQNCTDCTAAPDPSQIHLGTWHDGTFSATTENGGGANKLLTASLAFEGVSVYVFCLTIGTYHGPPGNWNMYFYLDGDLVGSFVRPPNGDPVWQYNHAVYVNESLPSGSHTITLVNGVLDSNDSLALLDYIVYTRDEASTSSQGTSPTSSIAAPTSSSVSKPHISAILATAVSVGIVVIVAIIGIGFYICRRAQRNTTRPSFAELGESSRGSDFDVQHPLHAHQQVIPYMISTGETMPLDRIALRRKGPQEERGDTKGRVGDHTAELLLDPRQAMGEGIPRVVPETRSEDFSLAYADTAPPSYYE